ncbi:PspC domain-containing protein [Altererythrobacter sp. RZ02]|uniref:PspC domain-containing protein n=1 Tax=Pontixanthobacter rizhaonensis TaxID=2730337 RepID=A0A848QQX2_9SPHN|nr:PspC domain-containing protein [Pontixanthobacter rizhaonensis]NMW31926.1 PspC domain-containing protein [Pontixanthobacter rizhaonensis]
MSQLDRTPSGGPPSKGFRLDRTNAKIWGVCAGIANSTGIDPMIIRVGFVVGALVSVGTAALIYAAIGLIAD